MSERKKRSGDNVEYELGGDIPVNFMIVNGYLLFSKTGSFDSLLALLQYANCSSQDLDNYWGYIVDSNTFTPSSQFARCMGDNQILIIGFLHHTNMKVFLDQNLIAKHLDRGQKKVLTKLIRQRSRQKTVNVTTHQQAVTHRRIPRGQFKERHMPTVKRDTYNGRYNSQLFTYDGVAIRFDGYEPLIFPDKKEVDDYYDIYCQNYDSLSDILLKRFSARLQKVIDQKKHSSQNIELPRKRKTLVHSTLYTEATVAEVLEAYLTRDLLYIKFLQSSNHNAFTNVHWSLNSVRGTYSLFLNYQAALFLEFNSSHEEANLWMWQVLRTVGLQLMSQRDISNTPVKSGLERNILPPDANGQRMSSGKVIADNGLKVRQLSSSDLNRALRNPNTTSKRKKRRELEVREYPPFTSLYPKSSWSVALWSREYYVNKLEAAYAIAAEDTCKLLEQETSPNNRCQIWIDTDPNVRAYLLHFPDQIIHELVNSRPYGQHAQRNPEIFAGTVPRSERLL